MRYFIAIALVCAVFFASAAMAQRPVNQGPRALEFTAEASYHGATQSKIYAEKWPEDKGGVLTLFVRNTGTGMERITGLKLNGQDTASLPNVRWWRAWPAELGPGVVGWLSIKAVGAPLEKGSSVEVEILTESEITAKTAAACATPALRLGNVLPAQDRKSLYFYVRNDAAGPIELTRLLLNDREHLIGQDPALELLGPATLAPGAMAILKVSQGLPHPPLAPLAVRICGQHGGEAVHVGAGIRLTDPGFAVGTWSSDMPKELDGMTYARKLGIDHAVTGNNRAANMRMTEQFHVRTLLTANKGEPKAPDTALIEADNANPSIAAWMVRDEPELSGKPSSLMFEHTMKYWQSDLDTPAYLNLMTIAGYNEYAQIPDITCMDHYVMFAPNCIQWTGITRNAQMEEAIEYTDLLKENTEPVRMWAWAQLATSVWNRQPLEWGINYQFWAHVMAGSKGILWFKYGPGFENRYTPQVRAAERIWQQFAQVKTQCFYGEPLKNVQVNGGKLIARSLNSPDATLVIVLNNNYDIGAIPPRPRYTLSPVEGEVSVPLPAWITPEQTVEVTAEGFRQITPEQTDSAVSFKVSLNEDMGVYLIGKRDEEPPVAVSGLNAPVRTAERLTLSWREPYDNFGVQGYTVYRGDTKVTDTRAPIAELQGEAIQAGAYSVEAYDAAGNRAPRSAPLEVPAP